MVIEPEEEVYPEREDELLEDISGSFSLPYSSCSSSVLIGAKGVWIPFFPTSYKTQRLPVEETNEALKTKIFEPVFMKSPDHTGVTDSGVRACHGSRSFLP